MGESLTARVIAVHRERFALQSDIHGEFYAQLKSSVFYQESDEFFPTAGDLVEYLYNPWGDSLITHTLPRKSYFARYDAFSARKEQAIAANFDMVFLLTSANHDFNPKRLHRYLTVARSSHSAYAIIITKADLAENIDYYIDKAQEAAGENCPIYAISTVTGQGLDIIRNYILPERVIVFLGSSGVGKSTLVNALAGKNIMDVNGIREDDSKGRHTTTHRQMVTLDNGAMILDTPGMRELGLIDAEDGLKETFADIESLAKKCRFVDCKHQNEPGCAIRTALQSGDLSQARMEEYLTLQKEAMRHTPQGREERNKRQKAISKFSRQFKGGKGKEERGF